MKVPEIVEIDGVPGSSGTVPKPTHSWKCPTVDKELGNVSFEWNQPVTEGTRFNSIYKINRWEGGGNKAQKEMDIRKEDQVWNFSLHRAVQQKRADHHLSCARDNQSQYSYIFPNDDIKILVPAKDACEPNFKAIIFFSLCDCAGCEAKERFPSMNFTNTKVKMNFRYDGSIQTASLKFMPGYSDLNDLWMPSSKNVFYFGRVYEDTEHAFLPKKKTFQNIDPEKLSIEYLAEDPGSSQEIIGTNVLICKLLNRPHFKYISSEGKSFPGRLELLEIAAPKLKKAVETMLKERKTQNDPDSKKTLLFHLTTDSEATDKLWKWISYNDKTVVENSQFNIIIQLLEFSLENEVLDLLYTVCKEIKNKHVTTNSLLRSYQVFLKYKKAVDIEIVCLMRGWMGQQLSSRFAKALEEEKGNKLAAYDVAKKLFGEEIDENTVGELYGDICRVYKF